MFVLDKFFISEQYYPQMRCIFLSNKKCPLFPPPLNISCLATNDSWNSQSYTKIADPW